jgi:two-component system cell cycle sensor histidine kinase/response regulator CckA
VGQKLWEIGPFKNTKASKIAFQQLQHEEYIRYENLPLQTRDGRSIAVEFVSNVYLVDDKKVIQCNIRDITEHKKAELALRESETRYRTVTHSAHDAIITADSAGIIVGWNRGAETIFGYSEAEVHGQRLTVLLPSQFRDPHLIGLQRVQSGGEPQVAGTTVELEGRRRDGNEFPLELSLAQWEVAGSQFYTGIIRDITERKQLNAENERLTDQFHQAQKMESIGLLAGGIAHDFNNLLMPIIGYAELAMLNLAPNNQLRVNLKQIIAAGERAARLTRQILAFSRKQALEMQSLDLNQLISEFEPMLRRLIGEDIDLQTQLATDLPSINADEGQFEQVLLNLVVNARDALPEGGTLVIETTAVVLDDAYVSKHFRVQPGPYIMLTVTDTGHGMSPSTQQRIFEPFFTTKARGLGTGLGLATVFGIVKQHQGDIWVYSEPGQGTAFNIYLPVVDTSVSAKGVVDPDSDILYGTETVLLIEDESSVCILVSEMLKMHGYHVLAAEDPVEGLELAARYAGQIDLLLTDIKMPHLSGGELYRQLILLRPNLKVLYMSGYTDNMIANRDILGKKIILLHKPF